MFRDTRSNQCRSNVPAAIPFARRSESLLAEDFEIDVPDRVGLNLVDDAAGDDPVEDHLDASFARLFGSVEIAKAQHLVRPDIVLDTN